MPRRVLLERCERCLERAAVEGRHVAQERGDVVAPQLRDREPERAQHPGGARHEDGGGPDLLGEPAGVHAARAAEGEEGEARAGRSPARR